jgi:DNA-directed RNA polymerase subunit RPC12/RpoP
VPIFDFKCDKCGKEFESIEKKDVTEVICECGCISKRIFPKTAPKFNLKYNPKTDMVDWNGNKTRYWDKYKEMKEKGQKPRIPALDGDG